MGGALRAARTSYRLRSDARGARVASVDPGDREHVRQLERQRAPEDAAVDRDVEPVARRRRASGRDRPRRSRPRSPRAGRRPPRATSRRCRARSRAAAAGRRRRRSSRRRAAVATTRGSSTLRRVDLGSSVAGAEHLLVLDVDEQHALDRLDRGDHRLSPSKTPRRARSRAARPKPARARRARGEVRGRERVARAGRVDRVVHGPGGNLLRASVHDHDRAARRRA